MIAIRDLAIATGKQAEAESILRTFLSVTNQSMFPNRFSYYPNDEIEYSTIDATLWLFVALYEYYQKFKDEVLVQEAMPVLHDIIGWHIRGTRYNIHATPKGLFFGGVEGMQLT